jgi:nucleoside-diphosphate-sugar epimerase
MQTQAQARNALVVGISGTAGSAIAEALHAAGGWQVAGLARAASGATLRADLLDPASLRAALAQAPQPTHIFYTARLGAATLHEEIDKNTAAFSHLLAALHDLGAPLQRVVLMEGTKWYGSHLGRYPVPAVEADVCPTPYFYHAQQKQLDLGAARHGYTWSALRPHTVFGYSRKHDHNLLLLLAMHVALRASTQRVVPFPGTPERYALPTVATNSDMLARAALWSATADTAANQAFNVNNGDTLNWPVLWRAFCEFFGATPGEPSNERLADTMPAQAAAWEQLRQHHQLADIPWPDTAQWIYADGITRPERVDIISTKKIIAAGFTERADTVDSVLAILRRFRRERLIP